MKNILATTIFCAVFLFGPGLARGASEPSPLGYWTTIDDDGVTPTSVMEIYREGDTLSGRVVEVLREGADPMAPCEKCPGELKNQPVLGMRLIWGMKQDGDRWSGGRVLDPESGSDYSCRMQVEGDELHIRGYIGLPLLGRTQVWLRTQRPVGKAVVSTGSVSG